MVSPLLHETGDSFLKLHETGDSFLKPMINLIFFIYIVFHMKLADKKKSSYGKKSSKSPVSYANRVHFFILLSHSFSWYCRIKMAFSWQVSVSKLEFWASFMKPWYWHKMLKLSDSAGKKLKLTARGNFMLISRFHETCPKFNFWHWNL